MLEIMRPAFCMSVIARHTSALGLFICISTLTIIAIPHSVWLRLSDRLKIYREIEKNKAPLLYIDLQGRTVIQPIIDITGNRAVGMAFTGMLG